MIKDSPSVSELFAQNLYPVHCENWSDRNQAEYIPYDIIAPHEEQALSNHGQTLKRLAERGGLGWSEILAILTGRKWADVVYSICRDEAKAAVLDYIAKAKEDGIG